MVYLLDANVFIEAKNRHYGLDFCPAFWDWLLRENKKGEVHSIDKVYAELQAQEDGLSCWAKKNKDMFFPLHPKTIAAASRLSSWVVGRKPAYRAAAKDEFLGGNADYWLIAHAIAAGNVTIVTHETSTPEAIKRVKILDACDDLGVLYSAL